MRIRLLSIGVLVSLASGCLFAETAYKARDDIENKDSFKALFEQTGRRSWRTWSDGGTVLRSLIGRTAPVGNALKDAESVRSVLLEYLRLPAAQLRADPAHSSVAPGGAHYEFGQWIGERRVENTLVTVDVNSASEIIGIVNQGVPGLTLLSTAPTLSNDAAKCFAAAHFLDISINCDVAPPTGEEAAQRFAPLKLDAELTLYAVEQLARWAWVVNVRRDTPRASLRYVIDAKSGVILETRDRGHAAADHPHGRVFNPTPFTDPSIKSYLDLTAVRSPPYEECDLLRLNTPGTAQPFRLIGKFVEIVEEDKPNGSPRDDIKSADGTFDFERGSAGFASTMAYYHIDDIQRFVQEDLGISDMVSRPIKVDIRVEPFDYLSKYWNDPEGAGYLRFGYRDEFGQVFHAEDGDILAHEYGHALQASKALARYDNKGPETLTMGETRAMSEGFADYWAMSFFERAKMAHNLSTVCFGDWAGRSAGGKDCLRVISITATRADLESVKNDAYKYASVWTAVLWSIRVALGRSTADKLVLRSHEFVGNQPTFAEGARAIFVADDRFNGGRNHDALCHVFVDERKLIAKEECR